MLVLYLAISFSKDLVAGEAELLALFNKIVFVGGGMGIVAFHAITIGYHFVNAFGLGRNHRRVTEVTNLFGVLSQEFSMAGSVGAMTPGAFVLFQRGMHELTGHLLLKRAMAFHADVSACPGLQFEVLLGGCR